MTTKVLASATKRKKPAIIKENGAPRFVVLDWDTYRRSQEMKEDMEEHIRFEIAQRVSVGKKRYSLQEIRQKYNL